MRRPVMVIVEHRKYLALARKPRRLAVRELLVRFRERHAYLAQTLEQSLVGRRARADGVRRRALRGHPSMLSRMRSPVANMLGTGRIAKARVSTQANE